MPDSDGATNASGEWHVGQFAGYTPDEALDIAMSNIAGHHLRETGNGPEVSYEEDLLRQIYGEPDADGVYGRGGDDVG